MINEYKKIFSSEIRYYLLLLGITILVFFSIKIIKRILLNRIQKISQNTKTQWDDLIVEWINSVGNVFYFICAFLVASLFFRTNSAINLILKKILLFIGIYYGIKIIRSLLNYFFAKLTKVKEEEDTNYDPSIFKILNKIVNGAIWIIGFLIILQNFNIQVTALLGGLGLMGLVIAFGVRSIMEDIFSVFSLYIDRPFRVGDYILISEDFGQVKKIGLKSTRLKNLEGIELNVSNRELSNIRIKNYSLKGRSLMNFKFTTRELDADEIEAILNKVKEIFTDYAKRIGRSDFSLKHIFWQRIDKEQILTMTIEMEEVGDIKEYMEIKQKIILIIEKVLN